MKQFHSAPILLAASALAFAAASSIATAQSVPIDSKGGVRPLAYVTGVDQLNVRQSPLGGVTDKLSRGDEVQMLACDGQWCRVSYFADDLRQSQGLVAQRYLAILPLSDSRLDTAATTLSATGDCDIDCIIQRTSTPTN